MRLRGWLFVLCAAACDRDAAPPSAPVTSRLFTEELALPSEQALLAQIDDALEKKRRADVDRALDALEPGEQLEHARLTQLALDRQIFTLDDLFRVGDDLFAYQFRPENGLGNGLAGHPLAGPYPAPNLRRVQYGAFGGPDAMACAECHSLGGDDGAGTRTQNTFFRGDGDRTLAADERNPPAVLGTGPVERLAAEMSCELAAQRASAIAAAMTAGAPVSMPLVAKGLSFGTLVARADGSVDASGVTGVAADLIVRPFGWKGHQATVRGIVKEGFRVHMGLVPLVEQHAVRDGLVPAGTYGDGPWYDVDEDGKTIEVEDGMISTMVAYLAQLEVPVVAPPSDPALRDAFARGRDVFARVQCGGCHTPTLQLADPLLVTRPEQSENAASPSITVDVARDGLTPKIEPIGLADAPFGVQLFSDLRRHDLGPALASAAAQPSEGGAIAPTQWLTRPLWGLADTAPYLHDGRASTIDEAILLHGGEAQASRDAFAALPDEERAALRVYLMSLRRTPKLVAP
ncbi:MAG TPA: di-heme oxidoredictase family protein [Kofleriaceae bacterium]|nr:di-heme oxidoredictase family protein [Kofleriaceae bacterium]